MRAALGPLVLAFACIAPRALERHEFVEHHMGCAARIVLYAEDAETARAAARAAFEALGGADSALSDWIEDGALARVERAAADGTARDLPEELDACLARALSWSRATDGAFDVTVGPLTRIWREARAGGRPPASSEIERARAAVGWRHVQHDPLRHTLAFDHPDVRLDFGGIGQGFGADRALAALREHGIEHALVDVGGDIALGAPPPGESGWTVLADGGPEGGSEMLVLANCGVTTSGDAEQALEHGGARRSHVIDPRTGEALTTAVRATVVARDATDADALATALSVLGAERGIALAEELDDVEARVEERVPGGVRGIETGGYEGIRSQSLSSRVR